MGVRSGDGIDQLGVGSNGTKSGRESPSGEEWCQEALGCGSCAVAQRVFGGVGGRGGGVGVVHDAGLFSHSSFFFFFLCFAFFFFLGIGKRKRMKK